MASKPNGKGEKTLLQPIGPFFRNVSAEVHASQVTKAHRGPGYEPEIGPEYDVHEENDGVDDGEPFNFRLHLHQFDPNDRDSDAGGVVMIARLE